MFKMSRVAIEMYLEHLFRSVYVSNCFQFCFFEQSVHSLTLMVFEMFQQC